MSVPTRTIDDLVALATVEKLGEHGVDNWEGFEESIEDWYSASDDDLEDAKNWFNALVIGGVDNWEGFEEAMEGVNEYEKYLKTLPGMENALSIEAFEELVEVWGNLDEFLRTTRDSLGN